MLYLEKSILMKKIALLLTSILVMFSCSQEKGFQKIHVEGNKFVNESGQTVVFKGLCLSDPVKMQGEGQWSETVFAKAEEWGANMVRFAMHPSHMRAFGWEETFALMDQGVEWAKAHNLYVIIDWHSIGNLKTEVYQNEMYYTTMQETLDFWKEVARRYKDEPAVALYELFNEPTYTVENLDMGTVTWEEWRQILEGIIDTIREINPDAVCLCAGFNWAYDLTPVAADPVQRPGVAYVSHPYPMKREAPWPAKWEADWGYVADTYPVVCTELGYCLEHEKGAHIPVIADDVYGYAITEYLDSKGISFTIWCFDPDWGPMLISDWDYTPTTQGRFFKAYLQGK